MNNVQEKPQLSLSLNERIAVSIDYLPRQQYINGLIETWLSRPCVTIKRARFDPKLPDVWTDGLVLSYESFKTIERKDKTIKGLVEYLTIPRCCHIR